MCTIRTKKTGQMTGDISNGEIYDQ